MSDTPPADSDAQAETPQATPAKPRRKRRRWGRVLALSVAVLLLLGVGLIALAPTLLSTGPGTALVQNIANGQIPGEIKIRGLSLGWTGGVGVEEIVVDDPTGKRVLQARLDSDLGLIDAIRGRFHLGQARARLNLPLVLVYPDGTTNFGRAIGIDETTQSDEPTELPDLLGTLALEGDATVQQITGPNELNDRGPPVRVAFDGTTLTFGADKSLAHSVPLDLRVSNESAGAITADGTIDLNTLDNERPTLKETIKLQDVRLAAVSTLLAAFGAAEGLSLDGTLGGTVVADTATNDLSADLAGQGIRVAQLNDAGENETLYETNDLSLTAAGTVAFAESPATRPAVGDATTQRPILTLASSTFKTDDLTATLRGTFDPLRENPADDFQTLATDVQLDVQSDFLTVVGGGKHLGDFALDATGDVDAIQERFGDLVDFGVYDPAARFDVSLRTQQMLVPGVGPALVLSYDFAGENVVVTPLAEAVAEGEELPPPLRLGTVKSTGRAFLARQTQSVAAASAEFGATGSDGKTIATGAVSAEGIDADAGSVAALSLKNLALPDYDALRQTLAGWADLPENAKSVAPITATAVAAWDGPAKRLTVTQPLRVLLGGDELMSATLASASQSGETVWQVSDARADVRLPVAQTLLAALGTEINTRDVPAGSLAVVLPSARLDTNDPAASLDTALSLVLDGVTAQGVTVGGTLPLTVKDGVAAIPADATPLTANGGRVSLAGASLDIAANRFTPPPESTALADGVGLTPVLLEVLGQYVNPIFVDAESVSGFLDVRVTRAEAVDLNDPLGKATSIAVEFSLRDLELENDVIAGFADAAVGDLLRAVRGQTQVIAAVDKDLAEKIKGFDLSEEVKEEISSLRGAIPTASVDLRDGRAATKLTFDVADPRASGGGERYPLVFEGGVTLETLALDDFSVTIPRSLVEKWSGDSPGDLVDLFGQRPFEKLIPDGLTLGIVGTTNGPRPDVRSITNRLLPQLARAAADAQVKKQRDKIEKKVEDEIRKGLKDLFD